MIRLTRRAALALPLATAGCDTIDELLTPDKEKLAGERRAVLDQRKALDTATTPAKPTLPRPGPLPDWPQSGAGPGHAPGHLQLADAPRQIWSAGFGAGSGYRAKLTGTPVIAAGRVYVIDSDAVVSAFDAASGDRVWRRDTESEEDRSTNVGGGVAVEGDIVFAVTGRGAVLGLAVADGAVRWRASLGAPARAAPAVADGRLFVPILGGQILALSAKDGSRLWSHQASETDTTVLGLPTPAVADGIVVAGFGSGELVALRASAGAVAWTDSLASTRGRSSLLDLSAIRGMPVIADGRVYAGSLGGLVSALDLRSGRRLWEREIATADTPCVAGDWLFVLATDNRVAALNRADGAAAWITELPRFGDPEKQRDPILWTGPLLASDRLIVAGSTGEALAVSPYTGAILGRQPLPAGVSLPPVLAGGTLYIVTDDATLVALR